ncbi:uncharacterized protein LOC117414871 [Acipenser ruthenus]|uniref:uncharacterized protein LOC117414871 n=1 Tax=Acipenser ruthenus TaxID=7906 RepID=UPI00145BFCF2|nr:uncharacterized protein LOC117414871 [Acipenser ruthenus]
MTMAQQNSTAQVKHYQWMLHDGSQWLNLNHDSVIETHFCQPGAQGIALFTPDYGRIFLDFDKMEIQGGQMTPYRQISLSQDETEEYLWYFFENRHWHEYGSQGSSKTKASVTSHDIEQQYQINPQGSCTFTVGNMAYSLNFSEMTQSNPRTGMQRRVRRRPKYNSVIQKTNSLASFIQDLSLSSTMPPAGGFTWQFRGDEGVWREYKAVNDNGVACSVSSDDIEQSYQQNPQGQLQFTAGRFSYTLDFSGMSQFNSTSRTKRDVRRIPSENQQKSSSLQGMALSSATPPAGSYVWQFRGEEGVWTEYKTNNACGVVCSITSDDIEQSYQQNPQGQLQFTAGQFSYMLDCSGMFQVNNTLGTKRKVRRILCRNQQKSMVNTLQNTSNCTWLFLNINGTWEEYRQTLNGGICSVSSEDIEMNYQQNPLGTMNFTAGKFSYILDFSAMTQKNLRTTKTRQVRRLQQ